MAIIKPYRPSASEKMSMSTFPTYLDSIDTKGTKGEKMEIV